MIDERHCIWQRRVRREGDEPFYITSAGGAQRAQLPDQNVVRGATVRDLNACRAAGPYFQLYIPRFRELAYSPHLVSHATLGLPF